MYRYCIIIPFSKQFGSSLKTRGDRGWFDTVAGMHNAYIVRILLIGARLISFQEKRNCRQAPIHSDVSALSVACELSRVKNFFFHWVSKFLHKYVSLNRTWTIRSLQAGYFKPINWLFTSRMKNDEGASLFCFCILFETMPKVKTWRRVGPMHPVYKRWSHDDCISIREIQTVLFAEIVTTKPITTHRN